MIAASISLLLALFGNTAPTDGGARAPAAGAVVAQAHPGSDADVAKRAQAMLVALQAGTLDRSALSPDLNALLTPAVLADAAKTIPSGAPLRFQQRSKGDVDGVTTYVFRAAWSSGTIDFTYGLDDASGRIVTLFTRPGPPS